jgi:hypothetical protein
MEQAKEPLKLNIHTAGNDSDLTREVVYLLKAKFDIEIFDCEKDYFSWMINLYVSRTHYVPDNQAAMLRSLIRSLN